MRPSKLTPDVQRIIVGAVREGMYLEPSAALAGVTRQTIYNWAKRGEGGEEPYAAFFVALKKAEAEAELDLYREVRQKQDGWQSVSWVMERRWPYRWAARVRTQVAEQVDALTSKLKGEPELHRKVMDVLSSEEPTATGTPQH